MAQLERVTPKMVQQVARRYFTPAGLSVAAVGGAERTTVQRARRVLQHFAERL
jgi:hypothetical protein